MHLSDGVLPTAVTLGGFAAAAAAAAWSLRRTRAEDLPKVAVVTSSFFVASLIHVPLGPTSVHLLLPGVVGILLGPAAFLAIFLGLILQSFLFGFGGITALGANAVMLGVPAWVAGALFRTFRGEGAARQVVLGAVAGALAVALAALILALLLFTGGEDFLGIAKIALAAHIPVMAVEALITGVSISFLAKVKPELLDRPFTSGSR
jgi:cobalt/nickel transport system permease protein